MRIITRRKPVKRESCGDISRLDNFGPFRQPQSMEEINPNPEPATGVSKPPTSLASRLFNVFADPGEVFEEVKNSKSSVANWLVPTLALMVISVISVFVIFSQPAIVQQIRDQQASAMEQQVKDGKLTQAQADQALAMMDKVAGPGMLKIFGSVGAVFVSFIRLFWWAFILWLMAMLVLKKKVPFLKMAEVAGLASMVLVLGAVITTLLTVIMGKLGLTLSPALAISNFNPQNKLHMLLAVPNAFNIWLLVVSASGLSRLAEVPFGKALLTVVIYWLVFTGVLIAIGLGQFAL